jgi:hypothetical protein
VSFLIEILDLFKKGGFSRKKKSASYEFYKQRADVPFLFDFIYLYVLKDLSGGDYYVFCCQRFCVHVGMIFLGDRDALIGLGSAYAIGKDEAYDQFAAGYSYDMRGYVEDDSGLDAWNRVISLWEKRRSSDSNVIGALNELLFLDVNKNRDILYGTKNYPGAKPDEDRGDYKVPAENRYLIFIFFYLIRDLDNSLFWIQDILNNRSFRGSEYLGWLNSWALMAKLELESGVFREINMPKWAPIKTYLPGLVF